MCDIEVDLIVYHEYHPQSLQLKVGSTLWVILGPFAASVTCEKKTKVTVRINKTEMTSL